MALSCFNNEFQNPFGGSMRVYLGPRSETPHHGPGSVEDAMKTEAGHTKLEAEEKVRESKLLPDSVRRLNELIEAATPSQTEVILVNLDTAISQLNAIDSLRDMLDEADLAIAYRQFDAKYSDFVINPAEIKELSAVRLQATGKIALMEAHKVTDVEKLKDFAWLFLRDANGKSLDSSEQVEPGRKLTIDFNDPKTGVKNQFAEDHLTLGMILKNLKQTQIQVGNRKKEGLKDTEAYLWSNNKTYTKPESYKGVSSYVKIYQDYELTVGAAKTPEKPTEPAPALVATKTEVPAVASEAYNPDFVDASGYMTEAEYESAQAEDEARAERGELSYRRDTEMWAGRAEPETDMLITAETAADTPDVRLSDLVGKSVEVPEHFQGENSWEQIAKIKYLTNGETVYDAIRMMAAIHRKSVGLIDNRTMWQNLRGGILSKGGHWEISFNEMAKAVYGKNEKNVKESLPYFKEFKAAAKDLLETLDKTEDKGPDANDYRRLRESVVYTGEKADLARVTSEVFDRNSYGAPVSLNVFQLIGFAAAKKERPTITPDSWMKEAATSKAARGYETYGEQEAISHARAFDKMMAVSSKEEYLALANNYIAMGAGLMETQHHRGYFGKVKFEGDVDVAPLTLANLNDPSFKMTEAQITAIRYGAMYFASAEQDVYQKVEAEKKATAAGEISTTLADDLTERAAAGEGLTPEQKEQLKKETRSGIQGILGGYAAGQPMEDTIAWQAGVSAGVKIPLLDKQIPGRLSLQWIISANTLVPVIRTNAGIHYDIDFGKNDRWHAEAYAEMVWGLSDPSGAIGPNIGGELGHDITADGTVRVTAGGSLGLRTNGDLVGVHLSVDRNLDRVLQKKVSEFKGLHETELNDLRTEVYGKIGALNVDPVQKRMLMAQYEKYMDYRIAYDETKNFTKWYRQIKLISVGVTATIGLEEGGFAVGPYITFGVGFRARTLYVPPLETPEQVARSKQTGLPSDIEGYKAPEPDWIRVEVTDQQLWDGDSTTKDEALRAAEADRSKAFEAVQAGVADDIEMHDGDRFTSIDFKKLNGTVRLYTDARSGIETIQNGPQNLDLNLDTNDNLIVRILDIPASQGGDNVIVIGITNNPSASLDEIVSNSGNYLSWNQTLDGNKGNSSIIENPGAAAAPDMIMTRIDAEAKINSGSMTLGDLSKEGSKENVRSVQYEELRQRAEREEYSERFTDDEREMAGTIAAELITSGFGYNKLILSSQVDKIHDKIAELYTANGITPQDDLIKLVHQYAMENDRPQKDHVPLEWNNRAMREMIGPAGEINIRYWEANKGSLGDKEGPLASGFPEGSEFMVTINEKGDVIMLGGYYNRERYGEIMAPVKWDKNDPASTLRTLGIADATAEEVKALSDTIAALDWEEKPIDGADFNVARKTMTGDKLITTTCSNDLYGPDDGAKLREMAKRNDPNLYPELSKEFAEDVVELLANKQAMIRGNPVVIDWEVYSGLDNKCFNLTFARNVKLVYEKPEKKMVQSASTREKKEGGMTQEMKVKYNTFRIAPGLIPVSVGQGELGADEGGSSDQGDQRDDDDTEDQGSTGSPR